MEKDKQKQQQVVDKAIKAMKETAAKNGIDHFLLAFDANGLLTTHLENMNTTTASRAVIALFQQICKVEANNKASSPEYRQIMTQLEFDFLQLVSGSNKEIQRLMGVKI